MVEMSNEERMGGTWKSMKNFVRDEMVKRAAAARERATELRAIANKAQKDAEETAAAANAAAKKLAGNSGNSGNTRKNRKNRKSRKSRKSRRN
jgi:hypothetical protein